jgi:hypothetical protein
VPVPLELAPATLPTAVEGQVYDAALDAGIGGTLQWRIADGELPAGLGLGRSTGTLSGTPTESGEFVFTVAVQTATVPVRRGERRYSLEVLPELTVAGVLPGARVQQSYSHTLNVEGGIAPYSYDVTGLPAGLSFNASTGRIFGTPLNPNPDVLLEIEVTDSGDPQQTATVFSTLVIQAAAVEITTETLPGGVVGDPYSAALDADEGVPPYTWSVVDGILPAGLRLNTALGVIDGTPTEAGSSTFTIEVVDSDDPASSTTAQLTIEVLP